jgi:hypothetical protein
MVLNETGGWQIPSYLTLPVLPSLLFAVRLPYFEMSLTMPSNSLGDRERDKGR